MERDLMQTLAFKRVLVISGISALACFISTFSTLASTNYVTDPGFELGTTVANGGWSAFGGSVLNSTGHVRTGTKAVRLPAGNGIGAFETISNAAFTAGTQFDL